ncbi:hypothetical protein HHI36_021822, partial [Cryptolaemus montrouzieri]
IGPKKHLEELGIPVIQDLPVGQKMYDHLTFPGLLFSVNQSITLKTEDLVSLNSFFEWKNGRGPYTGLGGIADKQFKPYWDPLLEKPGFQVFPMLLYPKSYGFLRLRSRNPLHFPKLYGNFFTDKDDIKTFIAGIRESLRIVESSPALQRYNAGLVPWPIPGCEREVWKSDAYWECGLRRLAFTLHHQITTCKMGPKNDPEATVDHKLKVHGVKRLRVADSSIIPSPIAAHTNVPAIMIGEKAADMIKQDWQTRIEDEVVEIEC